MALSVDMKPEATLRIGWQQLGNAMSDSDVNAELSLNNLHRHSIGTLLNNCIMEAE